MPTATSRSPELPGPLAPPIACLRGTMHDPATFSAPQIFDPDRFSAERAEDKQPNRFIPHGGAPWDGHRCAGQRLAEFMMQVYATPCSATTHGNYQRPIIR